VHSNFKRHNRVILFVLVFFTSTYLLTASGINLLRTDAGELRFEVTKSIVENFDVTVSPGEGVQGTDGRYYSWLGIGSAVLAVPFYIAGKFMGFPATAVYLMNPFFAAATAVLVLLFCISLGYSERSSLLVTICYGVGTIAWPYAKHPFDNIVETFFVLSSVYCMYLYSTNKKTLYILCSSSSLGLAFITRQTSLLIIPALSILLLYPHFKSFAFTAMAKSVDRGVSLFVVALLPFIGLIFWYDDYRFGSIFETGYSLIASRMNIDFFTGTQLLTGFSGFLISPGKGYFYYSPAAILFFFSIKSFVKKYSALGACFICIFITYLLFLSKNIYWHGDWAWGPRYLLVITPFLMIPVAQLFDSIAWLQKKSLRIASYVIITVSIVIQLAAVSVDFKKYFFYLIAERGIQFTVTRGYGVQPIIEPPSENYFEWNNSPILDQFKFINTMAFNLKNYRYSAPRRNSSLSDNLRGDPSYNVFDYWWLQKYCLYGRYSGFIWAVIFLCSAIFCGTRLLAVQQRVNEETNDGNTRKRKKKGKKGGK